MINITGLNPCLLVQTLFDYLPKKEGDLLPHPGRTHREVGRRTNTGRTPGKNDTGMDGEAGVERDVRYQVPTETVYIRGVHSISNHGGVYL